MSYLFCYMIGCEQTWRPPHGANCLTISIVCSVNAKERDCILCVVWYHNFAILVSNFFDNVHVNAIFFNLRNFLLSDFIACLLCLLGYAVDFDIACTGDGEAIGNASLELSHMGYDFTFLFLDSMGCFQLFFQKL